MDKKHVCIEANFLGLIWHTSGFFSNAELMHLGFIFQVGAGGYGGAYLSSKDCGGCPECRGIANDIPKEELE